MVVFLPNGYILLIFAMTVGKEKQNGEINTFVYVMRLKIYTQPKKEPSAIAYFGFAPELNY